MLFRRTAPSKTRTLALLVAWFQMALSILAFAPALYAMCTNPYFNSKVEGQQGMMKVNGTETEMKNHTKIIQTMQAMIALYTFNVLVYFIMALVLLRGIYRELPNYLQQWQKILLGWSGFFAIVMAIPIVMGVFGSRYSVETVVTVVGLFVIVQIVSLVIVGKYKKELETDSSLKRLQSLSL